MSAPRISRTELEITRALLENWLLAILEERDREAARLAEKMVVHAPYTAQQRADREAVERLIGECK